MSGLELNKIAASILLAGIIAMVTGIVTDVIYEPETKPEKRGFQVTVTEDTGGDNKSGNGTAEAEAPVDVAALMQKASAAAGQEETKKCTACHTFEKGGANRVGPNLWAIVGAKKAGHEGYNYSEALKTKGGNWTEDDLLHFLHNPKKYVPGTKMGFAGFRKPEDAANVVAYLKTLK